MTTTEGPDLPVPAPPHPDLVAVQHDLDAAWKAAEDVRLPLRDRLRSIIAEMEGVTGLAPSSGAEKLIDVFLEYVVSEADTIAELAHYTGLAHDTVAKRDEILASIPPDAPPDAPSILTDADPIVVREWFKTANDVDVTQALSDVDTTAKRHEWAEQMLEWFRIDGGQAPVLAAVQAFLPAVSTSLPEGDPAGASANDKPIERADDGTIVGGVAAPAEGVAEKPADDPAQAGAGGSGNKTTMKPPAGGSGGSGQK